jgi:hypothetical protein
MGLLDKPLKPREYKGWSRVRAHGKWYFVGVYGVCYYGVGITVLWSALMAFGHSGPSSGTVFLSWFLSYLGGALIVFPIAGFVIGLMLWWGNERRYARTRPADSGAPGAGRPDG